jgi:Tfp pilus assembly pilus retraction ATPase PilT
MLEAQPEVSDLLFAVDRPLQVESFGELKPVACDPRIEKLTPFQTETVALNLIGDNPWHIGDLLRRGSCDTAYTLADKARFRINIFSQRGNYSVVLRQLNTTIPTLDSLKFPDIIKEIPREKTGLIHWRHRLGQVNDARGDPERDQRDQSRACRDAGGPGRVHSHAEAGHFQPARAGHGF